MDALENSRSLPDPDKIEGGLKTLFGSLKQKHIEKSTEFKKIRPYVIAYDPDFVGAGSDGWYPRREFVESRCMSKLMQSQIYLFEKAEKFGDAMRLKMLHWLQIIEADYPAALVLNALRYKNKQRPEWKFLELEADEKEKRRLRHPSGKFPLISSLFEECDPMLSEQFSLLYKSKLRNAIAHSHFYMHQDGGLLSLSAEYSFISREKSPLKLKGTTCITYTRDEFERIYQSAVRYRNCAEDHFRYFENLSKCC